MGIFSWFKRKDKTKVLERHTIKVMELLTEAKQLSKMMVKTFAVAKTIGDDVRADSILRERASKMVKLLQQAKSLAQETLSLSDVKRLDIGKFNSQMKNLSAQSQPMAELISKQVRQQSRSIHNAERFIVQSLNNAIEKYHEFEQMELFRKIKSKSNLESYARSIITLYAYTGIVLHNIQLIQGEEKVEMRSPVEADLHVIKEWERALLDLSHAINDHEPRYRIKAAAQIHMQRIRAAITTSTSREVKLESQTVISKIHQVITHFDPYSKEVKNNVQALLIKTFIFKNRFGQERRVA